MSVEVLGERALNRATLERQLLLRRSGLSVLDAVTHLVGLQAQVPLNPYLGLWSRLQDFRPERLSRLLLDREVVRVVVMRGTLHLVTADDALVLRPLVQPVLDQELARHPDHGPPTRDVDLEPVLAFVRLLLAERPRTQRELRAAIAERFPDGDAAAYAFACRNLLAFVQVPPRGVWGRSAQVTSTTLESWSGRPLAPHPSIDAVLLRYFAAFGPATAADAATWSRLTGMGEVIDRLRPELRAFRDERGRELFDIPDAPRPDPDTPAPPRFLPEYDNLLLSHADRARFVGESDRRRLGAGTRTVHGSVLVDGALRATWWMQRDEDPSRHVLTVDHIGRLTKRAAASVAAEGRRVLRFLTDGAVGDVRFGALD